MVSVPQKLPTQKASVYWSAGLKTKHDLLQQKQELSNALNLKISGIRLKADAWAVWGNGPRSICERV